MGAFLLLILFSCSGFAQSPALLYSNLQNATSFSVTQNFVYVVEQDQNRILKFDHEGVLVETVGGKGSGDYQFSRPVDIDATNGLKIFITDYNNRRVQVFDRRGQFLSSIYRGDTFGSSRRYNPTQISVNSLGEVFFVDETEDQIYRFDVDSNLMDEFRISSEIASVDEMLATSKEILVLDKRTKTIHRLALNSSYRGFLPADGVSAFHKNERGFWKVYRDRLELETETGNSSSFQFDEEISPTGIKAINNTAYILTSTQLFKITVE
ncbi:MAG: hypothetical protein RI561_08940 [Gracilimonas sp.]|nr:hypothetical protein [Gracilimonas sp.]